MEGWSPATPPLFCSKCSGRSTTKIGPGKDTCGSRKATEVREENVEAATSQSRECTKNGTTVSRRIVRKRRHAGGVGTRGVRAGGVRPEGI